jgi:hypothetical protein
LWKLFLVDFGQNISMCDLCYVILVPYHPVSQFRCALDNKANITSIASQIYHR